MRIIDSAKQRVTDLLSAPLEELGIVARATRFQIQLWRFWWQRLYTDNVAAMSAALSFRTIFALIPLLVLSFLMLKSLHIVEDNKQLLRSFMDEMGLSQIQYTEEQGLQATTTGEDEPNHVTVADKVEELMDKVESQLTVGALGPIGVGLLIYTALTLLMTIEVSLNRIFEAIRPRPMSKRILVYWSALTLGPVALITASFAGNKAIDAAMQISVLSGLSGLVGAVGWLGPIIVGIVLLAALYTLMPNTRVRFGSALWASMVVVPIWLVARWGFSLYVRNVGTASLYGALAILPLFLLWLNLSWRIFLFGAQVTHTAANLANLQIAEQSRSRLLNRSDLLAIVVAIAKLNAASGQAVSLPSVAREISMPDEVTAGLLRRLVDNQIVSQVVDKGRKYLLTCSPRSIQVSDILEVGGHYAGDAADGCNAAIAHAMATVRDRTEAGLEHMTIADVIKER